MQQVEQEARGWVQDRVEEATGRVEEATGKVEDTSPWAKLHDRQTTQGATGVAHW